MERCACPSIRRGPKSKKRKVLKMSSSKQEHGACPFGRALLLLLLFAWLTLTVLSFPLPRGRDASFKYLLYTQSVTCLKQDLYSFFFTVYPLQPHCQVVRKKKVKTKLFATKYIVSTSGIVPCLNMKQRSH